MMFPCCIIHELPNGIRGLLIAGLLAMTWAPSPGSKLLATTATQDWYQGIFKPDHGTARLLRSGALGQPFSLLLILVGSITAWYGASPGSPIIQ